MTYSERVSSSIVLHNVFDLTTKHTVRRLLARIHAPDGGVPSLPDRAFPGPQSLRALAAHGLRSCDGSSPLALRRAWALELEPRHVRPPAARIGILGRREAECGREARGVQTHVDDVRRPVGGRGAPWIGRVCGVLLVSTRLLSFVVFRLPFLGRFPIYCEPI
jgi:hypothetical protein